MANTPSAKKAIRVIERRQRRNQAVRTRVKTAFKRATQAIQEGSEEAADLARQAMAAIDRAAVKGVVHRNKAARKKSRLARRLNQATAR